MRRLVVALLTLAVLAAPLGAEAQPAEKVFRIGFLSQGQPPKRYMEALQQALRERGYTEGRNLVWEFRMTDGSLDQLPQFAEALVRFKVYVILPPSPSDPIPAHTPT